MRVWFFGLALLFTPLQASAQTAEQQAAVQHASEMGQQLYDHDRAAWLATDAMLAAIHDPPAENIHGWITERNGDGSVTVLFVRPQGDQLRGAFRAVYNHEALTEQGRVDVALTDDEANLYRARQLATTATPPLCGDQYNTVVLRRAETSSEGADIDVYLMPGATVAGQHPFGGYFRIGIDSAAGAVREVQRFTNGCLVIDEADMRRQGVRPEVLYVTQIIGDTPTEVHVFQSLSSHFRILVVTRSGIWEVNGAVIRLLSESDAAAALPVRPN